MERRILLFCLVLLSLGVVLYPFLETDRWAEWDQKIDRAGFEMRRATASYQPHVSGNIHDLDADTLEILRQLPGVQSALRIVKAQKPRGRIIHLKDQHGVEGKQFDLAITQLRGPLSKEQLDESYRIQRRNVELIQLYETAILRCLIKLHGLKAVHQEGYVVAGGPPELSDKITGIGGPSVAFRLHFFSHELEELRPCEDIHRLAAAQPTGFDVDWQAQERREDFIVKQLLLADHPVTILVLSAGHDLSNNVPDDAELIEVTPVGVK